MIIPNLLRVVPHCGLFLCLLAGVAGCSSSHSESPAPALPTAPPATQRQAETVAQDYVAALAAGNYDAALRLTSAPFRSQTPPNRLSTLMQGPYRPLAQAQGLKFDPIELIARGDRAVLRARFTGSDARSYRTNFVLAKAGPTWQISSVVPPAARGLSPQAAVGRKTSH